MLKRHLTLGVAAAALFAMPAMPLFAQEAQPEQPAQEEPKPAEKKEPIDFRKLKEVLPEMLAGLKRVEATGQGQKMGEVKFTTANGSYRASEENFDQTATLDIIDYGAMPEMLEALTVWQQMGGIETEHDNGYEKTTTVGGFPALQTYDIEGKSGNLTIAVAGRFFVTYNTSGLTDEQFKASIEQLPVAKLAELGK